MRQEITTLVVHVCTSLLCYLTPWPTTSYKPTTEDLQAGGQAVPAGCHRFRMSASCSLHVDVISLTEERDGVDMQACAATAKPAPGAPLATPFDTLCMQPCAQKAALKDQRTPLATWPSESDGSQWLASAGSAEARLEAPPGAGRAVAAQGAPLPAPSMSGVGFCHIGALCVGPKGRVSG